MASKSIILGSVVVLLGVFYQTVLKDWLYIFGVGRVHNRIEDFPFKCRRIEHPLLDACEDLVISHETRTLFAACSKVTSRSGWSPGGDKYNPSKRDLKDHVSVLNLDEPGEDGLYGLHQLEITGDYVGTDSHQSIDLHGFEVEVIPDSRLRFWLINHRPYIDDLGNYLDAKKMGANSTIEVFELAPGSKSLEFVKTIAAPAIHTPNNIAATGDGGFLITNDHNTKTGILRSFLLDGGSVTVCESDKECQFAVKQGITFPNGIVKGKDGLYYVSSSATGEIFVYQLHANSTLTQIHKIPIRMPLDNLSVDQNGDIYAAAFPDVSKLFKALEDPSIYPPSAVFRIHKSSNEGEALEYQVTKVIEDIEGKVLPVSTIAAHDSQTGSLWMGSVASTFITVCEPTS